MEDIEDKIKRINELRSRIKELNYFIRTIKVTEQGLSYTKLKILINTETITQVKLFGIRNFGCGSHESAIEVPKCIILRFAKFAEEELLNCENELKTLVI